MSNMVQISLRSSLDGEMSWPNPCTTTLSRAPIQSVPQCHGTGGLFVLPQKFSLFKYVCKPHFTGLSCFEALPQRDTGCFDPQLAPMNAT